MAARLTLSKKIIAGSIATKSRLHDQYGERVPLSRLARNGPRAVVTGLGRVLLGHRPVQPWISYDAQRLLARHLNTASRVLEFGSGMSTDWYAQHAQQVVSIEDFRPWYDSVSGILARRGRSNVRYEFAAYRAAYTELARRDCEGGFDLIMIDGSWRDECADVAIDLIRPGGIIYLDNADKCQLPLTETGNIPEARRKLLAFAQSRGAQIAWFTDFAPTQFFVQTGLAVIL